MIAWLCIAWMFLGDAPSSAETAPRSLAFVLEAPADSDAADNAAYEQTLADQADGLLRAAASGPSEPADALKAATFLLSRRAEPALSRLLHGIDAEADRRLLRETADRAQQVLASVMPAASAPTELHAIEAKRMLSMAMALAALGDVQGGLPASTRSSRDALLEACRALAPYLDDPQASMAGLARLLQGACYRRAGRADRAAEVLAVENRGGASPALDMFTRIEHCRALSDMGQSAAALALAVRLEARSASNMPIMHRTAAAHGYRALRLHLLDVWAERLAASTNPDERRVAGKVLEDAARLRQSFGGTPTVALFRLGRMLPD